MSFDLSTPARKSLIVAVSGMTLMAGLWSAAAVADPAEDALAKLSELSRQAEQLTESAHSAQLDLDQKVQAQAAADTRHAEDLTALEAAKVQLVGYQGAVDRLATATYMGGRTDGLNAILTAQSPQGLIDMMAVQRVMATEMSVQMKSFRDANAAAATVEAASAQSAAEAKAAADEAVAVRADLQRKQSQLQVQIAAVKSRYTALTPDQRAVLAAPPSAPADLLEAAPTGPSNDISPLAAVIPGPSGGSGAGAAAVQAALTRIGSPYSWGAAGPGAFDCSGLVMWAFQQAGIYLPHSSYALAAGGAPVSMDDMQPGDIVTQYSDASHVGIYVGDGLMVHASTYGIPVRVESIHSAPIYNVRRY